MALAALFPVLPQLFGVGYVELGLALSVFNILSAVAQAPMGFAVDHYGARRVLLAGISLGSCSLLLIALLPTYTWLLIGMALAGWPMRCITPPTMPCSRKASPRRTWARPFRYTPLPVFSAVRWHPCCCWVWPVPAIHSWPSRWRRWPDLLRWRCYWCLVRASLRSDQRPQFRLTTAAKPCGRGRCGHP
ncbi:MFS transporter [Pseudomonas shirazensis]